MSASPPIVALCLAALLSGHRDDPPADTLPAVLPAAPPLGLERAVVELSDASDEVVELGRRLFFDPLLSADESLSCASCHRPDSGFADPRPLSVGVRDRRTTRNAPTLFNRALGASFLWDGRATTLEEQVLLPIENPLEMDLALEVALARLAADGEHARAFEAAFGGPPDRDGLAAALAAFVRRLWIGDSPVDRFRAGEAGALSGPEKAGFWLYESRGGCWRCHSGPNFTDEAFHNTGVGVRGGGPEDGRAAITGEPSDRGRFKTPTLRGLALTAPYMHDGSLATLREVVEHYRRGGNPNDTLSPHVAPLELSERDVDNLVAFLEALSRRAEVADER